MKVERSLSIDEIFDKVKEYDLVFTSEASLADALDNRKEEAFLDHFATTPMKYVLRNYQNKQLLREKGLFIEIINNTDLSWKEASYLLENILDCWKEEGNIDSILECSKFDDKRTEKAIEVIKDSENVFSKIQNYEIEEDQEVAVVNFHQLNELDKQVLPEEFDVVDIFNDEKRELPDFKVYSSGTEIIKTIQKNVSEDNAQDVAIVAERESPYNSLVKSALQSKGITVMQKEELSENQDLRSFIRLLRLGINSENLLVKECQSVMKKLDIEVPIKLNNDFLMDISHENVEEFKDILDSVNGANVGKILEFYDDYVDSDLEEELEELGILDETVSEETVNRLEYYLDTYNIETDSEGGGVLLVEPKSVAYVDKPIVFYLGMSSSWDPSIPDKPWIDQDSKEETHLKNFKALIQNGEQKHYLVQDRLMKPSR